jgi:hypothetical protein
VERQSGEAEEKRRGEETERRDRRLKIDVEDIGETYGKDRGGDAEKRLSGRYIGVNCRKRDGGKETERKIQSGGDRGERQKTKHGSLQIDGKRERGRKRGKTKGGRYSRERGRGETERNMYMNNNMNTNIKMEMNVIMIVNEH